MSLSAAEQRNKVVQLMMSLNGKNTYSQSSRYRLRVDSGYGDGSSTVQYVYKKVTGMDPGSYTVAQINSKWGVDVDVATDGRYAPDEKKLCPGDLLFFRGTDTSRPYSVGHVEMYIGDGKIMGHGYGKGPTVKTMVAYCKSKNAQGRGYIKARRFIQRDINDKVSSQLIGRLQVALNAEGYRDKNKKKLVVDKKAGTLTLSACPMLQKGKSSSIVSLCKRV